MFTSVEGLPFTQAALNVYGDNVGFNTTHDEEWFQNTKTFLDDIRNGNTST